MVVGKLGFHVLECAVDRVFAVMRVDDDGVPDRLKIQNVGKIQAHLSVAGFDEHGIVAIVRPPPQSGSVRATGCSPALAVRP